MVDYVESSQLNLWLYSSPSELDLCRSKANLKAREYLFSAASGGAANGNDGNNGNNGDAQGQEVETASTSGATNSAGNNSKSSTGPLPVEDFACGFSRLLQNGEEIIPEGSYESSGPQETPKGHPFLSPAEESILVSFYVSKLPSLIGPMAQIPRLRRESKVTATACLLLRRFFLSNSVMLFDPKAIMTAAAFLGAKVEDAMTDVRYLEEGTALMNAPVAHSDILPAEIALLSGCHFDLLCFHPHKSVLALTEDLRTYLKSDKGKALASTHSSGRPLSGQDLKPIYDGARVLLDDVVISDLPLLYSPGQVGMAALWVAQERVQAENKDVPLIDLQGYIKQRFDDANAQDLFDALPSICDMLRALKNGEYGCCNSNTDLSALKAIHKKLKKVRVWGKEKDKDKEKDKSKEKDKDKKKNKRPAGEGGKEGSASEKRQKTSAV